MSILTPRINYVETKSPDGEEGKVLKYEGGQYVYAHPDKLSTATGSAPSYAARAWVNYNASMVIRSSGNVTTITYFSNGHHRLNFASPMPHANYAVTGTCSGRGNHATRAISIGWASAAPTINDCNLYSGMTGGANSVGMWEHGDYMCVAIFC